MSDHKKESLIHVKVKESHTCKGEEVPAGKSIEVTEGQAKIMRKRGLIH
jgi:hypothetical protein